MKKAGVIAGVVLIVLTGCFGLSTSQVTISASSNGNPVAGVEVLVDDQVVGTTGADGTLVVSFNAGTPTTVGARKALFQTPEVQSVTTTEETATVQIEMTPFIFVPDFGDSQIHMLNSVDAAPATFETITTVNHGDGTYTLTGPTTVYADYETGTIYVLDAVDQFTPTTLIRMTSFPPAADGSEADVETLDGGSLALQVLGSQALVPEDDGSVLVIDYRDGSGDPNRREGRIVQVPASLDHTASTLGTWFDGGFSLYLYGLTKLPGGSLVAFGGTADGVHQLVLDGVSDTTAETLGSFSFGTGTNEFFIPGRHFLDVSGSHLYVSDTGTTSSENNSRIVRLNPDGTGFVAYGTVGTGTDQFDNPALLGILPDNRLYIMDMQNDRLVRVDPGVFDGGASGWVESDAAASFNFDYWYTYS